MPVDNDKVKEGGHYAAGTQIRRVVEIATKTVERIPRWSAKKPDRKPIKKRLKRVRYQSRGHNAANKYGPLIWVDLDKFARVSISRSWPTMILTTRPN
jgi:hypothetical protein